MHPPLHSSPFALPLTHQQQHRRLTPHSFCRRNPSSPALQPVSDGGEGEAVFSISQVITWEFEEDSYGSDPPTIAVNLGKGDTVPVQWETQYGAFTWSEIFHISFVEFQHFTHAAGVPFSMEGHFCTADASRIQTRLHEGRQVFS